MLYSFLTILFPCKYPGSFFNFEVLDAKMLLLFLLLFCCCGDAMLVFETPVVVFSCRECENSLFEELINI